jgi:hypothetical protein
VVRIHAIASAPVHNQSRSGCRELKIMIVAMVDGPARNGVAKGTIYRFFADKDQLYAAVCMAVAPGIDWHRATPS